jgi:mono/diheme cytochrome c family protein
LLKIAGLLATMLLAGEALAGDSAEGRILAATHCGVCHALATQPRNEVAAAPPFDVIGRKYAFDKAAVIAAMLSAHPRLNFTPRQPDASDIADYIATLAR